MRGMKSTVADINEKMRSISLQDDQHDDDDGAASNKLQPFVNETKESGSAVKLQLTVDSLQLLPDMAPARSGTMESLPELITPEYDYPEMDRGKAGMAQTFDSLPSCFDDDDQGPVVSRCDSNESVRSRRSSRLRSLTRINKEAFNSTTSAASTRAPSRAPSCSPSMVSGRSSPVERVNSFSLDSSFSPTHKSAAEKLACSLEVQPLEADWTRTCLEKEALFREQLVQQPAPSLAQEQPEALTRPGGTAKSYTTCLEADCAQSGKTMSLESAKQAWLARRENKRAGRSGKRTYAVWLHEMHDQTLPSPGASADEGIGAPPNCLLAAPRARVIASPATSGDEGRGDAQRPTLPTRAPAAIDKTILDFDASPQMAIKKGIEYDSDSSAAGVSVGRRLSRQHFASQESASSESSAVHSGSDSDRRKKSALKKPKMPGQKTEAKRVTYATEDVNTISAEIMRRAIIVEDGNKDGKKLIWGRDGCPLNLEDGEDSLMKQQCQALNARYEAGIDLTMSSLPTISSDSLPSLPNMTHDSLPSLTTDSLPHLTVDSLPKLTIDSLPSLPDMERKKYDRGTMESLPECGYSSSDQSDNQSADHITSSDNITSSDHIMSSDLHEHTSDSDSDAPKLLMGRGCAGAKVSRVFDSLPAIQEELAKAIMTMSMDALPVMTDGEGEARTFDSLPDLDVNRLMDSSDDSEREDDDEEVPYTMENIKAAWMERRAKRRRNNKQARRACANIRRNATLRSTNTEKDFLPAGLKPEAHDDSSSDESNSSKSSTSTRRPSTYVDTDGDGSMWSSATSEAFESCTPRRSQTKNDQKEVAGFGLDMKEKGGDGPEKDDDPQDLEEEKAAWRRRREERNKSGKRTYGVWLREQHEQTIHAGGCI